MDIKCVLEAENSIFAARILKVKEKIKNDLFYVIKNLNLLWSTGEGALIDNLQYMENLTCAIQIKEILLALRNPTSRILPVEVGLMQVYALLSYTTYKIENRDYQNNNNNR